MTIAPTLKKDGLGRINEGEDYSDNDGSDDENYKRNLARRFERKG